MGSTSLLLSYILETLPLTLHARDLLITRSAFQRESTSFKVAMICHCRYCRPLGGVCEADSSCSTMAGTFTILGSLTAIYLL
ncbi:hypothetical protein F5Y03DRAFT_350312 [Xylaria venustula]|nr:hypothetical protein F5Y03DRAFT_350312 [Xylaria venustula]